MNISEEGRALIEAFEGCEKAVHGRPGIVETYHDSVGVLTIGYGHTNLGNVPPHIRLGDQWTIAQCDAALGNDMHKFERDVEHALGGVKLAQHEFDALVSFDFNTGSLARSSIPGKLKAGHKQAAMLTLVQYDHAGGRELAGLTRRRQAEKLLFEGKVAAALKLAGAHVHASDAMSKAARPAPAPPEPQMKPVPPAAPTPPSPPPASPGPAALPPHKQSLLQRLEELIHKADVKVQL